MSAWIASDEQFNAAVLGWSFHTGRNRPNDILQEMADILKRENVRSVNWRYNERTKFTPVVLDFDKPCEDSVWQVIFYLRSIDYQSCERDDYEKSRAFALNHSMQSELYALAVDPKHFEGLQWSA
jgi:hypothetical protein